MFSVNYHPDTGRIISYQEGMMTGNDVANFIDVVSIEGKRIDPDNKTLKLLPINLVGEDRSQALFEEVIKLPEGCFVEIGVYRGGSAWYLLQAAKKQKRKLHLFDTFTGIPYKSEFDPTPIGCFGDTNLDVVKEYLNGAIFHIGIFPETLTDEVKEIAFVHFDGDQYQGVKDVKKYLWPRMVSGGKIYFDDSSLHGGMEGVNKAIDEDFSDYKIDDSVRMKYVVKP